MAVMRYASRALTAALLLALCVAGARVSAAGDTRLAEAAMRRDVPAVRKLLDDKVDVNAPGPDGTPALHWVVRVDDFEMARRLIRAGADASKPNRYGVTPMQLACANGNAEMIALLLEAGADPNVVDKQGETALMTAARVGSVESVNTLLDHGANVDANGITPLLMAITNNHVGMARYLIEQRANVNAVDWYGRTPLWAAIEMRNMDVDSSTFENGVDRAPALELIRVLLDKDVDVNARTKEVPPIRRQMLHVTGDLSWVDFTGQTPFLRAALSADLEVMRLLLAHGADPKIPAFAGTTALMAAAGVNWVVDQTTDEGPAARLDAVKMCYDLGMSVNDVNSMGLTAVMGAANRGSDDIIQFLVDKGARLDVKDKENRTPLNWAEGVFLATHPGKSKPSSMALIKRLMGSGQTA